MFLRRITITGFKSFANKTVLDLEPGITAVVGPNGSGKSNLADAIRWTLGEQSKSRLRLSGRDEVVFAGTDKRARASYAEVVLLFNNEDGAFPLELTEVEISRRLYRSGESDYRLAGRSVRLSDIQALLAQAGFGASTYAVIGQGMIDSFLLSSPSERKLLFDEAAGIRGPELGRESAARKLAATAGNLTRLRDIAAELAPRLASLERAVSAATEQRQLQQQVSELRATIIAAAHSFWSTQQATAHTRLAEAARQEHDLRHQQRRLTRQLAAAEAKVNATADDREQLQQSLAALEAERDRQAGDLAAARAELAALNLTATQIADLTHQLEAATTDLATATERADELESERATNLTAAERATRAVDRANQDVAKAQAVLMELRRDTADGSRDQYLTHALQILKTLAYNLDGDDLPREQVRLLVHKIGRLLSHASRSGTSDLLAGLKAAQKKLETAMARRETAVEHQTNITITARSIEIDQVHHRDAVTRAQNQVTRLQTELATLQTQLERRPGLEQATTSAAATLAATTSELETQRDRLTGYTPAAHHTLDLSRLATALERTKSTLHTTLSTHQQAHQALIEAKAALHATHHRAKAWGLTVPSTDHPGATAANLAELENNLIRLEAELAARTTVQQDQANEYAEVSQRHTDLTTQIADLERAEADLQHIIAELDLLIRQRFRENFQALATQFTANFTRLFGGGTASLELQQADDGNYGVIIKASPKGKRLTALAALSGGERALTGVALLAAILHVNPSPFVVLDEIDAALDEANSGRLADILGDLQDRSQLIVITHNRQTMRAARVLFGVTMNEHHVSRLLSMRLEDATALAAR